MKPDDLSERLLEVAGRVGKVVDALPDTRLLQSISKWLHFPRRGFEWELD